MRKIIAAMNMTLDGFCNHEAMSADEEIHQHYTELLRNADVLIYGRTTYQLMEEAWPPMVENPTGDKGMDDFAVAIDNIQKIVYSRTLEKVTWKNSTLKKEISKEDIARICEDGSGNAVVGSPGMIAGFTNLGLIDEYQLAIHPVILGKGLTLFKRIQDRVDLRLRQTKTFEGGSIMLYYERLKK